MPLFRSEIRSFYARWNKSVRSSQWSLRAMRLSIWASFVSRVISTGMALLLMRVPERGISIKMLQLLTVLNIKVFCYFCCRLVVVCFFVWRPAAGLRVIPVFAVTKRIMKSAVYAPYLFAEWQISLLFQSTRYLFSLVMNPMDFSQGLRPIHIHNFRTLSCSIFNETTLIFQFAYSFPALTAWGSSAVLTHTLRLLLFAVFASFPSSIG